MLDDSASGIMVQGPNLEVRERSDRSRTIITSESNCPIRGHERVERIPLLSGRLVRDEQQGTHSGAKIYISN